MRPYRFFPLAIGVVALMSSCGSGLYCPHTKTDLLRLSDETRHWFRYSSGQTILFQEETGNLDTLTVTQFSDSIEQYWQGDECPDRPQEVIRVRLVHQATADTTVISGEFTNQLSVAKAPLLFTYFTDNHKVIPDNQSSIFSYSTNLVVGTETFSEVLTVRCPQCNPNLINELYIAKKIGIAAYRRQKKLWVRKR